MDSAYIEQADRLSTYRIGLFVLAGFLALAGTVPWVQDIRTQRKQRWLELLAQDRYRLAKGGKAAVKVHLEKELPRERADYEIDRMNLDKEPAGGPPPEPRTINVIPPMVTWTLFLMASAAAFAADGVRRRQLALIQAVADANRANREEEERRKQAAAAVQPVMPEADAVPEAPPPGGGAGPDT